MIHTMGNIDCFELREISSKAHCLHCLKYRTEGIVYCTCGKCVIPSEYSRKFDRENFDARSIPHFVIKKGARHGACHGKSEAQREYYQAKDCLSA